MALEPLRRPPLYRLVAQSLMDYIAQSGLQPGDRLPSERVLRDQLQVSRAPVREALRVLDVLGHVEIRPGQGTFVGSPAAVGFRAIIPSFDEGADMEWLVSLLEAREVVEPNMAALAAERISPEQVQRLDELLAQMEEARQEGEWPLEVNREFHSVIAEACGNMFLRNMGGTLIEFMEEALQDGQRQSISSVRDHAAVVDALRKGDGEAAHAAMMAHHKTVLEGVLNRRTGLPVSEKAPPETVG